MFRPQQLFSQLLVLQGKWLENPLAPAAKPTCPAFLYDNVFSQLTNKAEMQCCLHLVFSVYSMLFWKSRLKISLAQADEHDEKLTRLTSDLTRNLPPRIKLINTIGGVDFFRPGMLNTKHIGHQNYLKYQYNEPQISD